MILEGDFMMVIPIIIFILAICIFIFVFAMILSPKLKGKMMSRQIESLKHMTNYSKDDLETIISNMGDVSINSTKNIFDKNDDKLNDITEKATDLSSIAFEKTARAIKKGFTETNIYCKHCGKSIDSDSKFCKHCGKEA